MIRLPLHHIPQFSTLTSQQPQQNHKDSYLVHTHLSKMKNLNILPVMPMLDSPHVLFSTSKHIFWSTLQTMRLICLHLKYDMYVYLHLYPFFSNWKRVNVHTYTLCFIFLLTYTFHNIIKVIKKYKHMICDDILLFFFRNNISFLPPIYLCGCYCFNTGIY